ncbi:MAG: hypothetical protein M3N26_12160 [Pseudomonadota bacterium]|nr:hypothetical protein [Pseudomonadota bacterium]
MLWEMVLHKILPPVAAIAAFLLTGCVAPEEAPQARVARPSAATPAANAARFEDAPMPNRRAAQPSDSIIKVQNK